MKRRDAIKHLGFGVGALVATPSIMSLLQSCESEPGFIPKFVSRETGHALREIVDLILPSDETIPGGRQLNLHRFVDGFWAEMMDKEGQAFVNAGLNALSNTFTSTFNKPLNEGKAEEFDQLLSKYLKSSKEEQEAYNESIGEFMQKFQEDETVKPNDDAATFAILGQMRGLAIWGWTLNEQIGKEVLWYDPTPGQQIGCMNLGEAGNNGNRESVVF